MRCRSPHRCGEHPVKVVEGIWELLTGDRAADRVEVDLES
jgi:hypothetical protein